MKDQQSQFENISEERQVQEEYQNKIIVEIPQSK